MADHTPPGSPPRAWKVSGPVLPEGESQTLYVVDGHVTYEHQSGAPREASGWIVPGLVDAHCHIGLASTGAVDEDETERQALLDREAGALLLRDCGSPADTRWVQEREDLPRLIRAGRHLARTRRYLRNFAHEVEPEELVPHVVEQAGLGDGWVKLVGDWIDREVGDLAPSFPRETFEAAIAAAHDHGAKVTAHCFGHEVLQGLLDAGIDCLEHGTGLDAAQVEQMAAQGTALVPTVMQLEQFPDYAAQAEAKFPSYAATMEDLYRRRRDTIMAAYEAGVAIYAGSDAGGVLAHGSLPGEVRAMAGLGIPAVHALGAASWHARSWLGWNADLSEGAPADFVVYPRDPVADLGVLDEPSLVVLRGRVVGGSGAPREQRG